ncbi:hypothetical protein E1B28_006926 [Marasmius oreades]|uniref:Carboxylic ester hydrolase n=1 Tax=Marasmius oreades TaxID=181124 RepID=A0A9P7S0V8_9AGAR|nr:uncharacterized protein E1B28_006926 [Marasmius oreades]KAG7093240.1 hypothetical protein E1B28_006926 [Marasmius oreades]
MLTPTILSLLAVFNFWEPFIAAQPTAPIVNLGYARYQGVFDGTTNITSFLGMRFAAAPVGKLRWQAPNPPLDENDKGVQKADTQPAQCSQAEQGYADRNPFRLNSTGHHNSGVERRQSGDAPTVPPTSEDCLFLNVQYPGNTVPITGLPVLVYIHGGGYVLSGASLYDGSYLIEQSSHEDIVVVLQYRLGLFGFLAGKEIKEDGALNAGLLDQNFAFRWIRQHISKFGGDPERVTLLGKSAGAGSVLQHIIAEDGKTSPQLFRGAIAISPFFPPQYKYDERIPKALYKQVVNEVNCTSAQDTLACLRSAETTALQDANAKMVLEGFYGTYTFVPVVDGEFITRRPTDALKRGKINGEFLYAVNNAEEGSIYVNTAATNPLGAGDFAAQLFPTLGSKEVAAVDRIYRDMGSPFDQQNLIIGDATFICPAYYLLDTFGDRAFKSEFAVPPANHLNDIPYYFPSASSLTPINFNNTDFIEAFVRSFVDFTVFLDPNVKINASTITPEWGLYRSNPGGVEMVFNKTAAGGEGEGEPDIRVGRSDGALLDRCSG